MNCLITGASKGIGEALAYKFASLGYNLYLTYVSNYDLILKIKDDIQNKYQVKCFIKKCDLKVEDDILSLIRDYETKFKSLDILVNNAGIYMDNLIEDKTKNEFMKVLEVNVVGTFLLTKYSLRLMREDSIIINMASTDGIDTYNLYNIDYAVSKAGIIQLTKSLALILKQKVIAIAPNWVATESTLDVDKSFLENELKRIGQKELIPINKVVDIIINSINNKDIKSGEVIKIYE